MIDFRAIIDTNEIYKHPDTRIEYALLQQPYESADIKYVGTLVYEAAAISEDGEEVKLRWRNINEDPDSVTNDWDDFEVVPC